MAAHATFKTRMLVSRWSRCSGFTQENCAIASHRRTVGSYMCHACFPAHGIIRGVCLPFCCVCCSRLWFQRGSFLHLRINIPRKLHHHPQSRYRHLSLPESHDLQHYCQCPVLCEWFGAFARGSGGASTATCLQSVTGAGCNNAAGWLNRFNATAAAAPFPIIAGASAACAGGKNVGSINVGCTANGPGSIVSFAAPVQSLVAAVTARFYVGCQPITSCSSTSFGGTATCSGTATSCGGNVALAAQSYPLPCTCSSVNWLYRQSSTGFVTARVRGVCPV